MHYGSDTYCLGPWSPSYLAQLLSGLARLDLGPDALHELGFKFDLDPKLGRWNPNLNPGVPPAVAGRLTPIEQLLRHTATRLINTNEIPVSAIRIKYKSPLCMAFRGQCAVHERSASSAQAVCWGSRKLCGPFI